MSCTAHALRCVCRCVLGYLFAGETTLFFRKYPPPSRTLTKETVGVRILNNPPALLVLQHPSDVLKHTLRAGGTASVQLLGRPLFPKLPPLRARLGPFPGYPP